MFRKIDLSHARRVFVVGDIHGSYSKLMQALSNFSFDPSEGDHLISVGDLVDRGPENQKVVELIGYYWFHAIRGNHEDMIVHPCYAYLSKQNGGEWFFNLDSDTQEEIRKALSDLPVILEAKMPSGKRIGFCHATYPSEDWNEANHVLNNDHAVEKTIWDRTKIKYAKMTNFAQPIANIDHVYYGHTPLENPITLGNQSWIDTGAYHKDGYFTIIEIT